MPWGKDALREADRLRKALAAKQRTQKGRYRVTDPYRDAQPVRYVPPPQETDTQPTEEE